MTCKLVFFSDLFPPLTVWQLLWGGLAEKWLHSFLTQTHGFGPELIQLFAAESRGATSQHSSGLADSPDSKDDNICNRTTGKCLLGTFQSKAQPGSSQEVFWPQIFPLLLTVVVVEGRAWSTNWPLAFYLLCYVLQFSTGQNNVLLETPATREGISTLVYTF